jgi:hypothetical protein
VAILTYHDGNYLFMPLEVMLLQRLLLPANHADSYSPGLAQFENYSFFSNLQWMSSLHEKGYKRMIVKGAVIPSLL